MMRRTRIALYETRAGKFISEFKSIDESPLNPRLTGAMTEIFHGPEAPPPKNVRPDIYKAAVFENWEKALGWFRPGRLTNKLLDKLGLMDPEFIE